MVTLRRCSPRWLLVAFGVGLLALSAVFIVLPSLEPRVELRTGPQTGSSDSLTSGCYASDITGELVPDVAAGTAIVPEKISLPRVAVDWPPGFSGRRTWDGQVEVLNEKGNVVARTGTRIELSAATTRATMATLRAIRAIG